MLNRRHGMGFQRLLGISPVYREFPSLSGVFYGNGERWEMALFFFHVLFCSVLLHSSLNSIPWTCRPRGMGCTGDWQEQRRSRSCRSSSNSSSFSSFSSSFSYSSASTSFLTRRWLLRSVHVFARLYVHVCVGGRKWSGSARDVTLRPHCNFGYILCTASVGVEPTLVHQRTAAAMLCPTFLCPGNQAPTV